MKEIHVHCPHCRNGRLFDLQTGATGMVKIKCPICKSIACIPLEAVDLSGVVELNCNISKQVSL